ncbi:MAG: serine hydrolase domain-containing protein [Candidatus Dormibacteria bacterium]
MVEEISATVRRIILDAQRRRRLVSLVAVVAQEGRPLAEVSVGLADVERGLPAGPEVQYRLGSITKTLTAVGIMQQVEAGRLSLEQPLEAFWPGAPHGRLRLDQLLSHTSGLQREPVGEVWETLEVPSPEQLAANAAQAQVVLEPGAGWHYSNLGFALLGELLARVDGRTGEQYIRESILTPLGMDRTSWRPEDPAAVGYSVTPYQQEVVVEPAMDTGGIAPAQLWSTAHDLWRWADFLGRGDDRVLPSNQLELMRTPRVLADLAGWTIAWGLGLMLVRRGTNVFVGHTGGMPGFLAAAFCSPQFGTSVALLCNTGAGVPIAQLAAEVLEVVGEVSPKPWRPGSPPPRDVEGVLGRWWSEWTEWVFTWSGEALEARPAGAPEAQPERYRQLEGDRWVVERGGERGEEMRVVRDADGRVVKLYIATYPFTREPRVFGDR